MPDFSSIDRSLKKAVEEGVFPGAVLLVSQGEEILIHEAWGFASLVPEKRPLTRSTIFDLASLTKPLATTPAIMALISTGRLGLDQTLNQLGEPFLYPGKEEITIRQLLAHSAGLPAYRPYYLELEHIPGERKSALRDKVRREPLGSTPGTETLYSDLGFIYLEWIFEVLNGQGLHQWTRENIYQPLGLKSMGFRLLNPHGVQDPEQYAATEECPWRGKIMVGEVHDENAYAVGGVSGHAGLFGTAREVYTLVRALKRAYEGPGTVGPFDGNQVRTFWQRPEGDISHGRCLGFDHPEPEGSGAGRFFSHRTVGHLGFTGTSFWSDLDRDFLVVLLTNRVHPTRRNERIKAFRPLIHDLIFKTFFDKPVDF